MSNQYYNIVFRGDLVFGFQITDVKLRLQQLFKTDEARINALFTGKLVVIKRQLDLASAEKYRAVLLQAGAQVEVVAAESNEENLDKSRNGEQAETKYVEVNEGTGVASSSHAISKTSMSAATNAETLGSSLRNSSAAVNEVLSERSLQPAESSGFSEQDWSLAPVGADLLKASEQNVFIPRAVDTSAMALRPVGDNLLDPNEQRVPVVAAVNVPRLELAEAGQHLMAGVEQTFIARKTISEWQIAPVGTDLIGENEKPVVLPVALADLNVEIAPVGADLGQIKPVVKPVVPDISKLHLAD